MLLTPEAVYIGLSARTDAAGAAGPGPACSRRSGGAPWSSRRLPVSCTSRRACSLVDDHTLLATRALAEAAAVPRTRHRRGARREEPVANALCVNGAVLIADGFPKTRALLARRGYDVRRSRSTRS